MPQAARDAAQDSWMKGAVRFVVATVAFGMGVDNASVRLVAHFVLPKDLSSYYQEAGRAGRDGAPARCLLFYSRDDCSRLEYLARRNASAQLEEPNAGGKRPLIMVSQAPPAADASKSSIGGGCGDGLAALEAVSRFCEVPQCRRLAILNHFGEATTHIGCQLAAGQELCDFCAHPHEVTVQAERLAGSAPDRGRSLDTSLADKDDAASSLGVKGEAGGVVDSAAYYRGVTGHGRWARPATDVTASTSTNRWSSTAPLAVRGSEGVHALRTQREREFFGEIPSAEEVRHQVVESAAGEIEELLPSSLSGAARLQLRLAQLRQRQG